MKHALGDDVVEVAQRVFVDLQKVLDARHTAQALDDFCKTLGSAASVFTSRLSQTPVTCSCGSRSRNTKRMFLASCRMKFLRTGGLLMVISGKTLTISFMGANIGRQGLKNRGADYKGNCSTFDRKSANNLSSHQNRAKHR